MLLHVCGITFDIVLVRICGHVGNMLLLFYAVSDGILHPPYSGKYTSPHHPSNSHPHPPCKASAVQVQSLFAYHMVKGVTVHQIVQNMQPGRASYSKLSLLTMLALTTGKSRRQKREPLWRNISRMSWKHQKTIKSWFLFRGRTTPINSATNCRVEGIVSRHIVLLWLSFSTDTLSFYGGWGSKNLRKVCLCGNLDFPQVWSELFPDPSTFPGLLKGHEDFVLGEAWCTQWKNICWHSDFLLCADSIRAEYWGV